MPDPTVMARQKREAEVYDTLTEVVQDDPELRTLTEEDLVRFAVAVTDGIERGITRGLERRKGGGACLSR